MYIAIYPLPLVYSLYTCENVDNCEQPLIDILLFCFLHGSMMFEMLLDKNMDGFVDVKELDKHLRMIRIRNNRANVFRKWNSRKFIHAKKDTMAWSEYEAMEHWPKKPNTSDSFFIMMFGWKGDRLFFFVGVQSIINWWLSVMNNNNINKFYILIFI